MASSTKKRNIWTSLDNLFYISRILGIIPYSLSDYNNKKLFQISIIGNIWSIIIMTHNIVQYHFATVKFSIENEKETGSLTVAIGIFIIYMEPFMMAVDILAGIINQKSLIDCIERLQKVDEKLTLDNIKIDYKQIKKLSMILCLFVIITECGNNFVNLFTFQEHDWKSLWYIVTCLPLLTNSIARIWFLLLVFAVRERFRAINDYFIRTKDIFLENKRKYNAYIKSDLFNEDRHDTIGYLGDEIFAGKQNKSFMKRNKIFDSGISISAKVSNEIIQVIPAELKEKINDKKSKTDDQFTFNNKEFLVSDKMDKKLILLCRLHDEICEIGKLCNKMFSFQMLITMAFGFMSITAQCYFLYCGVVDQFVPKLFQSAKNVPITLANITITSIKCISIIYISWKTKTDAQKTGIHLHKIANVVDENHYYHIVNHLSLKLLNHQLNFTACGFFDLDMTTIYAITGAITSYLIILIQFNLAAVRVKKPDNSTGNITTTMMPFSTTIEY